MLTYRDGRPVQLGDFVRGPGGHVSPGREVFGRVTGHSEHERGYDLQVAHVVVRRLAKGPEPLPDTRLFKPLGLVCPVGGGEEFHQFAVVEYEYGWSRDFELIEREG